MNFKTILLLYILCLDFWSSSQIQEKPPITASNGTNITLPKVIYGIDLSGYANDVINPPGFNSPYTIGPDVFLYHKATADGNIFVNLKYYLTPGLKLMPSLSVWQGKPGVVGSTLIKSVTSIGDATVDNVLKISFKASINQGYWIMLDCGTADGYSADIAIYNSAIQPTCANIGFENADFSNWIETEGEIINGCNTAPHPIYFPTTIATSAALNSSSQHSITTSGIDQIGKFPKVCPGLEGKSLRLGDSIKTMRRHKANTGVLTNGGSIEQQFLVTKSNSLFTYYYAVVLEAGGHTEPNKQPTFRVDAFDKNGGRILCGEYLVVASGSIPGFKNAGPLDPSDPFSVDILYKTWTPVFIDLTKYIDSSITVRFTVMDCGDAAHFGYAYVDAVCQPLEITGISSVCNGGKTSLHAPKGGDKYEWMVKGDVTNTVLSSADSLIVNPSIVTTYQCKIVSVAGCTTILEKLITPEDKAVISTITGDLDICTNEIVNLKSNVNANLTTPWEAFDNTIVSIDNTGKVKGLKVGSTKIRFKTEAGCKRDTLITVNESAIVTGTTSFCKGLTTLLKNTTQTPDLNTPWTSADATIAQVDVNGKVTGIASGSTTITFLSSSGCKTDKIVTVSLTPNATNPGSIKACDSYTLPAISGLNLNKAKYFDDSQANHGNEISGKITSDKTIWIFDSTGVCVDEKSFTISIATTPSVAAINDVNICSGYKLPALANGNYYTGSKKTGVKMLAGDSVKSTQKIYVYDEASTNSSCFAEKSFQINVNTSISKTPKDSTVCDYFILPTIANVSYYKGTNQTGGGLSAGDSIKTNQKIYAYINILGPTGCTTEKNFTISVNSSPKLVTPTDIEVCDSIVLPPLLKGSYYTGTLKSGVNLMSGKYITSSQNIYVYDETGTIPNCFVEKIQKISISKTPFIKTQNDTTVCDSIQLPNLTVGNYFSGSNQGGTNYGSTTKLKVSSPVYIYAEIGSTLKCKSEKLFQVIIKNAPSITTPAPLSACDSILLPVPTNGKYFTATLKGGIQINAGTYIKANKTLYLYDETGATPNCYSEKIQNIKIDKSSSIKKPNDTSVCDVYNFPKVKGINLTGNEHFFNTPKSNLSARLNSPIKSTTKIYIYDSLYVCSDEKNYTVTVKPSPKIDNPGKQSICDTFKLKKLTGTNLSGNENYYFGTQKNNGKVVNLPITKDTLLYIYDKYNGCIYEDSFKVVIGQKPILSFQVNKTKGCIPFTTTFLNTSTNIGDTSIWYFGNDSIVVYGNNPLITYTVKENKCYDVSFKTSNHGCVNKISHANYICGNSSPVADFEFTPKEASVLTPEISFVNTSSKDATTFDWDFGDDSTSKKKDPIHTFHDKPQNYVITLIASNKAKCSSIMTKSIEIIDQLIYYIPNTFTPDGDDLNNFFKPIFFSGFDPQNYELLIFNRWGEIVFESHDTSIGWDGTYGNNPCLDGTYSWTVKVTDTVKKEIKNLHGHVNLIR